LANTKSTTTDTVVTTDTEIEAIPTEVVQLSKSKFEEAWNHYAEKLKLEGKANEHITLYNKPFEITDGAHVVIQLDNEIQVELLEQMKMDLLQFLKSTLSVPFIKLSSKVVERKVEQKIYTDSDKLKFLSEQYPILEDIKKRFGLESNY
jgi:DNA polymerase-3 subunit gamma/tau